MKFLEKLVYVLMCADEHLHAVMYTAPMINASPQENSMFLALSDPLEVHCPVL